MKPIRKYISVAIVISVFFFLILNIYVKIASKPKLILLERIRNITVDNPPKKGEQTIIYLEGVICCPCYAIHSHQLFLDETNRRVSIILWINKVSDFCPQVLVYFKYDIYIIFPLSGTWIIKYNYDYFSIFVYN